MPVLCNSAHAPKMVGLPVVLLWKLAALVMFHHPCFLALNPLGYQALIPANFEMNVVESLTGVVMCSSSAEAVWTGIPGPWVDLSTFLKLALVLLTVLIWQLAFLLVCPFPFALPYPLPQQCLLCVHFLFLPLGLPALPTMITLSSRPQSACAITEFFHNAHAYFTIQIRMRSHRFFSQCACVFHRRMDVACVHTRTRSHSS